MIDGQGQALEVGDPVRAERDVGRHARVGHAELDGDDQHQHDDDDERRDRQQGEAAGAEDPVEQTVGLAGAAHGESGSRSRRPGSG